MYKIFLICLFVSCTSASDEHPFREDYKYYEEVNGWIKWHKIPANWHDARLRCHAEGASLASPSNFDIRNIMISVMIAESTNPAIGIYSGIHSTFSVEFTLLLKARLGGNWTTLQQKCVTAIFRHVSVPSGVSISALPVSWATGQPDHVYTENCVIFHMNGTLEDVPCDDVFEYICYKKFEAFTINKCNTVDNEYKWDGRTGHCYKFHRFGQTWSRAHMICIAEGGYLAVINSDTEAEILKELFEKYPKERIFSVHHLAVLIGFREWPDERSWYTVHGQTLEEAGYNRWLAGQPDNMVSEGETQNCGAIWRNGLLEDTWCNQLFAFICEKDPEASYYIY